MVRRWARDEAGGTGATRTPRAGAGALLGTGPGSRTARTGAGEDDVQAGADASAVAGRGPGAGGMPPRAVLPVADGGAVTPEDTDQEAVAGSDGLPEDRVCTVRTADDVGADAVGAGGAAGCVAAVRPAAREAAPCGAGAGRAAGSARSGTAGARCTTVSPVPVANGRAPEGPSSPVAGRPEPVSAPERRLSGTVFMTPMDGVPVKDGFCQVGSRPPNPASATAGRPESMARWIGGRPVQAATAVGIAPEVAPESGPGPSPAGAGGTAGPACCAGACSARPRSRSMKPTAQPSAPARVTKDAIRSA
ncbi:hypothetical protein ACFYSH_00815 [Streptomyces sp. NPDC005791]|uniref:hypothetical protein n=1 Tax=Streptomyces sp. NPDC005791 TaxID=3364732 RepID=UPI0036C1DDE6